MIKCSNCKAEVTNDRWTICPECGSELQQQDKPPTDAEQFMKPKLSVEKFENAEIGEALSEDKAKRYKKSLRIVHVLIAFAFFASIAGSMITDFIRSKNRRKRQTKHYHNNYSSKTFPQLDKIIKENKFNADAYYARANKLLMAAKFEEAVKDYEQSLKISPYYINNYYGIGQAKRRMKDLSGSLAAFDTLVQKRPKYWQAWFERGVTCQKMKKYNEVDICTEKIESIKKKKGYKAEIIKRAGWEERYIKKLSGKSD